MDPSETQSFIFFHWELFWQISFLTAPQQILHQPSCATAWDAYTAKHMWQLSWTRNRAVCCRRLLLVKQHKQLLLIFVVLCDCLIHFMLFLIWLLTICSWEQLCRFGFMSCSLSSHSVFLTFILFFSVSSKGTFQVVCGRGEWSDLSILLNCLIHAPKMTKSLWQMVNTMTTLCFLKPQQDTTILTNKYRPRHRQVMNVLTEGSIWQPWDISQQRHESNVEQHNVILWSIATVTHVQMNWVVDAFGTGWVLVIPLVSFSTMIDWKKPTAVWLGQFVGGWLHHELIAWLLVTTLVSTQKDFEKKMEQQ